MSKTNRAKPQTVCHTARCKVCDGWFTPRGLQGHINRAHPRDVLAGRAPDVQLYRGVRRYVESLGGNIVVIGGIEIQEWPEDRPGMYRVAVKVLGRKPTKKLSGAAPQGETE